ncbi:MAG: DUF4139 domain-containing protein [Candidatus Omnitrophica bacterium]|nr:DUF4139 domain-containing protein [Candidatus Omnitrophota bacterium]
MKPFSIALLLALAVLPVNHAQARVKLAALPERARVVISLSHPDATLVEEERLLPLQEGINEVDFSWKGVNIDPNSIQVRMLEHPDQVVVINTSYPPNENALVWAVSSPQALEERIRICYLLQGLDRDIAYRAVVEPDEQSLTWRDYLRLRNNSGEDFTGAEILLGYGPDFKRNLQNDEILELLSERIQGVPIKKQLTWDSAKLPWDPEYEQKTVGIPLSYVITNDTAAKLGTHTLLPGKARIFLKAKPVANEGNTPFAEGITFIGEDWVPLVPVDRELKLSIGQSREVKVTQRKIKDERTHIRRNNANNIVLWDTDEVYRIELENFKKSPSDLVLVEHVPGYWRMVENSNPNQYRKKDAFTFEYTLTLPPESNGDKKTIVSFTLNRLNVQGNEPQNY